MVKPHSKQKDNISDTPTALFQLKTSKKSFYWTPVTSQEKKKKTLSKATTWTPALRSGGNHHQVVVTILLQMAPVYRKQKDNSGQPSLIGTPRLCNSSDWGHRALLPPPTPPPHMLSPIFPWFKAVVFPGWRFPCCFSGISEFTYSNSHFYI